MDSLSVNNKWSAPLLLIGVVISLCSCHRDQLLVNQQKGRTELAPFLLGEMAKYGVSLAATSPPSTSGLTNFVYCRDKDGLQIVCEGNRAAALLAILKPALGEPKLMTTNSSGPSSFVYSLGQSGVAVNCSVDSGYPNASNRVLTHLVIVRVAGLR